jgi:hypothetical protein
MTAPTKRPVPEAYVIRRIRRKLHAQGQELRVLKTTRLEYATYGRFYIVNDAGIVEENCDLHDLAARLGVLKAWERIEG